MKKVIEKIGCYLLVEWLRSDGTKWYSVDTTKGGFALHSGNSKSYVKRRFDELVEYMQEKGR